jgi:hypothetical protein
LDHSEAYPRVKRAAERALANGLRKDPNYVYAAGAQDALEEAAARKACPAPTSVSIMRPFGVGQIARVAEPAAIIASAVFSTSDSGHLS